MILRLLAATMGVLVLGGPALAQFKKAEHPFILWTKEDVAAIKKRLATEPWAQEQLKALPDNTFGNLFRYQVLGDEKAGQKERAYLLSFFNAPLDGRSSEGKAIGLHYDNYLSALRYDVLYDSLTPEQRAQLQATFRRFIDQELQNSRPVGRFGILPNLALPRRCAGLIMTVALQDEALIKQLADQPRSLKWFLDTYLADGRFYGEEFGKMTSILGEFLIYARGLDRLGMSSYGFDFKGANGATLRRYLQSYIELGYPRIDGLSGTPVFSRISMGDARGGSLVQHTNVPGFNAAGEGGWELWYSANMNGRDHRGTKVIKLQFPQWFEIVAARYPDATAERYFLAQMRRPGQDRYYPTLFWGLDPIDPKAVEPPPAPSWVAPERGLAFLRANNSPDYWTAPDPAVAFQFAQMYVHNTSDCFSLLGYYQFNRPIYVNRAISAGYNGGPWDFHVRGHCGVVVDNQQAQPIGIVPVRSAFTPAVQFVSARGVPIVPLTGKEEARPTDQPREPVREVYSNTDLSRSLFLTRAYLLDVYILRDKGAKPRNFWWLVHAPGSLVAEPGQDWQPAPNLQADLFRTPWQNPLPPEQRSPEQRLYDAPVSGTDGPDWVVIQKARRLLPSDQPLAVTTLQSFHGQDLATAQYGAAWYERKVGVRVRMLGGEATTAYVFDTPTAYTPGSPRSADSKDSRVLNPEYGGVSVAFARRGPAATYIALHEPYQKGTPANTTIRAVARTADGVAVAVSGTAGNGAAVNDRVLLQFDQRPEADVIARPDFEADAHVQPLTLGDADESFTFRGHGFVRITPEAVEVTGPVTAGRVKVAGSPKVVLNGKDAPAKVAGGVLSWGP